jgi:hypothetical protein
MLALYDIQDILERAQCPYVLLKDTARSIVDKQKLEGDGIYIGVMKKDVNETALSTIKFYLTGVRDPRTTELRENGFDYEWNGVPVHVKFIERKYKFFKNPDFRFYMANNYSIPNPFENYWTARFIIK